MLGNYSVSAAAVSAFPGKEILLGPLSLLGSGTLSVELTTEITLVSQLSGTVTLDATLTTEILIEASLLGSGTLTGALTGDLPPADFGNLGSKSKNLTDNTHVVLSGADSKARYH